MSRVECSDGSDQLALIVKTLLRGSQRPHRDDRKARHVLRNK